MIVGFDSDDTSVFPVIPRFLQDARIGNALVGLLHAIPTTPLHARLKRKGRLNGIADSNRYGTNVIPRGMAREELRDGFAKVMQQVYGADDYFARIDALFLKERFRFAVHGLDYWRRNPRAWNKRMASNYAKFAVLSARLLTQVEDRDLRRRYRAQLRRIVTNRPFEPHILFVYAIKIAMHYHYAAITKSMQGSDDVTNAARSFSRTHREVEGREGEDKAASAA